jgi:hypothetical protein
MGKLFDFCALALSFFAKTKQLQNIHLYSSGKDRYRIQFVILRVRKY